jgi:nitrogen fixation NifU-like protein
VGTGRLGAPALGNVIKLQIKVAPPGVIIDACFKVYGGVALIAAASWISVWVKEKTLSEAAAVHNTWLAEQMRLPPAEIQGAVWVERALRAALADYQAKVLTSAS